MLAFGVTPRHKITINGWKSRQKSARSSDSGNTQKSNYFFLSKKKQKKTYFSNRQTGVFDNVPVPDDLQKS